MRIQISKSANAESFYVIKSVRKDGKNTSYIVEKLGTLEQVKLRAGDKDPYVWAKEYARHLTKLEEAKSREIEVKYKESNLIPRDESQKYNIGYLFLQKLYYQLGLKNICTAIERRGDFEYDLSSILSRIVYSRIIAPKSKLSTFEYSKRFFEQPNFELHSIYRALDVLSSEKDYVLSKLYKYSGDLVGRDTSVLYYDCTNYFFELEQESGIRKYGHSKENCPLPIVQMGLLIDGNGIPLSYCITGGNTNEQKTLTPLEEKILSDYELSNFIVCTDSGLSSGNNKFFNSRKGRNFITATSFAKLETARRTKMMEAEGWRLVGESRGRLYNIEGIEKSQELYDKYYESTFYKEEWFIDRVDVYDEVLQKTVKRELSQRLIVTFSLKYKAYLQRLRENQIARAEKMVKRGDSAYNRKRQNDPKNYIKAIHSTESGEVAETTTYGLDEEAIKEASKYDGFYAVYTSLSDKKFSVEKINAISHGRWEIEECFRILKTEFRARPVYLQKDNRIEAHFLTCFIALLVLRILEEKLSHRYTYAQILDTLADMDICKAGIDGFVPAYMRTELTDALHEAFSFRTDYEYLSKNSLNNICFSTKKAYITPPQNITTPQKNLINNSLFKNFLS